jgi:DNA-binding transcriptional MerR regulator
VQIGELAERSKLSLRTIRHYDQVGLLQPTGRTEGGFRIYSEQDYQRLLMIRQARALGFSLEEIMDVMTMLASDRGEGPEGSARKLKHVLEEALERRQGLARDLERADEFIAIINERIAS